MNIPQWQARIRDQLTQSTAFVQRMAPGMTYASLATATLLPVILAVKGGDITALMGLYTLLGNVGTGLITNLIQEWKDREEAETVTALPQTITDLIADAEDDEAQATFDKLINTLETVRLTLESGALPDPQAFVDALRAEVQERGSTVEVHGDWVAGDKVAGDKVGGDKVAGDKIGTQVNNYPSPQPTPPRHDRYLQRLRNHCHALPITAMGGDATGGNEVTLDKVYIDLDTTATVKLTRAEQAALKKANQFGRDEKERPLTAREAAQKQSRLVLLGAPGGGKSSFVRQLLAQLIVARMEQRPAPSGFATDLFPMLTILRELAARLQALNLAGLSDEERDTHLLACLEEQWAADLARFQGEALQDALRDALLAGKVLLVFDGLDEMATAVRPLVRMALAALLRRYPTVERVIVTCRVRSYVGDATLPGFAAYTLADFTGEKIHDFVAAWYNAQAELGRLDRVTATQLSQDLQGATRSATLRSMAENPMLLTTMALLHQREKRLPKHRVELYDRAVGILLNRWQESKGVTASAELTAFLRDESRVRPLLERLAYEAHRQVQKEVADLPRLMLFGLLEDTFDGNMALATEFLDYADHRAGLLVGQGGDEIGKRPQSYTFPHRTFQEYLAGCYLLSGGGNQRISSVGRIYRQHATEGDAWQLAALLGAEELLFNRRGEALLLDLMYDLCPVTPPQDAPQKETAWRTALWSGQMALLVDRKQITEDRGAAEGGQAYLDRLVPRLLAIMRESPLNAIERAEAGRTLAKLGDPRVEVLDPLQMVWCEVPAGPFIMGSDEYDREKPQHIFDIPYTYNIALYPITNAQFLCFVEDGGYAHAPYWEEAVLHGYWEKGQFRNRSAPYPSSEPFNMANHPVVGVTWYEAVAFTRWLTQQLHVETELSDNLIIRLPTEVEWEKAARGDDGLRYPWGAEPDPNRANYSDTGIGAASAVGAFPGGRTPCGAEEMIGNVSEWCSTIWLDSYEGYASNVDSLLADNAKRAWRGGSFGSNVRNARSTYRGRDFSISRNLNLGFRVVCCPHFSKDVPPEISGGFPTFGSR